MRRDPNTGHWVITTTGRVIDYMTRDRALRLLQAEDPQIAKWNYWMDMPALSKLLPDLENANLSGLGMEGIRFRFGCLAGADLRDSWLYFADLREAQLTNANLSGANLSETDLRDAELTGADLTRASLRSANLSGSIHFDEFGYGRLNGVDLRNVKLTNADLMTAQLRCARLAGADLTGCDLRGADLTDADLDGTKLDNTILGLTYLIDIDLTAFCEASDIIHFAPSVIDWLSVSKSLHCSNLHDFLIRAGMPEVVASYTIDIARSPKNSLTSLMRSAFISYGGPDEHFARRLYETLHSNGVQRLFLFPESAIPGDPIHSTVRKGIGTHDRMLLVCSRASLDRRGVRDEVLKLLARESREGVDNLLIPIDLDGYVRGWRPHEDSTLGETIRDRVIADFRGWDNDDRVFSKGLAQLLSALRKLT